MESGGKYNQEISISTHFWFTAITIFAIAAVLFMEQPLLLAIIFLGGLFLVVSGATELQFKDYQFLAVLFFIIIVLPPLSTKGSLRVLRPEVFIFLTIFPYYILTRPDIHSTQKFYKAFIYSLITFTVYILFSIIYARIYLETPIAGSDFLEVFKYLMFIVILLTVNKLKITEYQIQWLLYAITGFFFLAALLGMLMFYGILGTDHLLGPVYFFNRMHDVNARLMGTFFNPNTFGTALSLAAVVALGLFFHTKHFKNKLTLLVIIGVFTFCVILTQSRTAVVTLGLAYLTFVAVHTISGNLNLKQMLLVIGFFSLLIVAIVSLMADVFVNRILSLADITEDESWLMRLSAWQYNLYVMKDSWIFGLGPAKAVYTGIVDNEFILILRRYGVVGFIIHSFIYLIPVLRSVFFFNKKGVPLLMAQIVFVSSVVLLVSNITSQPFHEIQLMSYWFIFLGIFFILPLDEKDKESKIE